MTGWPLIQTAAFIGHVLRISPLAYLSADREEQEILEAAAVIMGESRAQEG